MSEVVYRALDAIRENPKNWNQGTFLAPGEDACGTVMCLAGHILDRSENYDIQVSRSGEPMGWVRADGLPLTDGYSPLAAHEAGITENAGYALFLCYPLMAAVHPDYLAKWTEVVLADQSRTLPEYEVLAAEFDVEFADGDTVSRDYAETSLKSLRGDLRA